MKVEGQCHCGAITYEAEVEPGTIAICNCADCQMQSGSVFRMNIPAPATQFRIFKGRPQKYIKTADSGTKRVHAFLRQLRWTGLCISGGKPAELFVARRRIEAAL
jgi:hypothetical protein